MIYLLMGVSGSGKSTIGRLLAGRLDWRFYDGDDFHPPANVAKMRTGRPLNDTDRVEWLDRLRGLIDRCRSDGESAVIACSALKEKYRRRLDTAAPDVQLVYLRGSRQLIEERVHQRTGHFMPAELLDSQFATLEEPEEGLTVDIQGTPKEIAAEILSRQRDSSPTRQRKLMMEKVNLQEKLSLFNEYWQPRLVAELNGQAVKLAKLQGEFVWHHHEAEDELFLVIKGRLQIQFRDRNVWLDEGEMIAIPAGVEHRPVAPEEVHVLLFEPLSTLNTGNVQNERTVARVEKI